MTLSTLLSKLSSAVLLAGSLLAASAASAQSTLVRLQTTQGPIEMQMLDAQAPLSVANFLAYARAGDWADLFFSRSVKNFVVQAGGFRWPAGGAITVVTKRPSVTNEFNTNRSNLRGTVALAKIANQPNSGTSEWFINQADNSGTLNGQNGGFTVFARVTTAGMATVDKIGKLQIADASTYLSVLTDLPLASFPSGTRLSRDNLVLVTGISIVPPKAGVTDSQRIFDHLESLYPQYLPAEGKQEGTGNGYLYRYFPASNTYIGTKDNQVWYRSPALGDTITSLGSVTDWLFAAAGGEF